MRLEKHKVQLLVSSRDLISVKKYLLSFENGQFFWMALDIVFLIVGTVWLL